MQFSDKIFCTFTFINYSNSYYNSCFVICIIQDFAHIIDSDLEYDLNLDNDIINKNLTIVIGLLGSDKIYYDKKIATSYNTNNNLLVFDDIMQCLSINTSIKYWQIIH